MIRTVTFTATLEVDTKLKSARVFLPQLEDHINKLLPIITFDPLDGYTTTEMETEGLTLVVNLFLTPKG